MTTVFRTLYALLDRRRRRQWALALALMIVAAIAELATVGVAVQFLGIVSQAGGGHSPTVDWLLRLAGGAGTSHPGLDTGLALLLVAVVVLTALARLAMTWFSLRFAHAVGHDLARRLWRQTLHQSYPAHLAQSSSVVLGGLEKIRPAILLVLLPAMQALAAGVVCVLLALLLLALDARAAAIVGALTLLVYLVTSLATRERLRANALLSANAITARTRLVQEGLGGFRDILLARSQDVFVERFRRIGAGQRDAAVGSGTIAALPRFVGEAAAIAGIVLVMILAARTPGGVVAILPVLGAFALGGQRLLLTAQQAFSGWTLARGELRLLGDIVDLIEASARTIDPSLSAPVFAPADPPAQIRVDAVSFAYPHRDAVLDWVDLTIRRGERIGLMGASGSGKSTLLDLLMGLLDPGAGTVWLGDAPLTAANRSAWQASLAHVPQHIYLSEDSIAANIAFGVDPAKIDAERLRDAAARACVADFVEPLPHGFATLVGERGVMLSGGQRQRIGIARALYRAPTLLVLDEATSALDDATETRVLQALADSDRGMTIVIVAHRRSSLWLCDRIVQLDHGRIA